MTSADGRVAARGRDTELSRKALLNENEDKNTGQLEGSFFFFFFRSGASWSVICGGGFLTSGPGRRKGREGREREKDAWALAGARLACCHYY